MTGTLTSRTSAAISASRSRSCPPSTTAGDAAALARARPARTARAIVSDCRVARRQRGSLNASATAMRFLSPAILSENVEWLARRQPRGATDGQELLQMEPTGLEPAAPGSPPGGRIRVSQRWWSVMQRLAAGPTNTWGSAGPASGRGRRPRHPSGARTKSCREGLLMWGSPRGFGPGRLTTFAPRLDTLRPGYHAPRKWCANPGNRENGWSWAGRRRRALPGVR